MKDEIMRLADEYAKTLHLQRDGERHVNCVEDDEWSRNYLKQQTAACTTARAALLAAVERMIEHRDTALGITKKAEERMCDGEPVAWRWFAYGDEMVAAASKGTPPKEWSATPLYTHPAQPLSDLQISECVKTVHGVKCLQSDIDFVRATERARGISHEK